MLVSGFSFLGSSDCLFAREEARKLALSNVEEKRTFFPEDVIDPYDLFHSSLLLDFGVVDCPRGVLHAVSKLTDSILRTKKPFIHIRDEEFSAVPPGLPISFQSPGRQLTTLLRITVQAVADYLQLRCLHQRSLSFELTGEFSLDALPMGAVLGSHPGYARFPTR